MLAPPCDPWSQIQNLNMRRPDVVKKLLARRRRHQVFLRFCREIFERESKGRLVVLEQPNKSLMLQQPLIHPIVRRHGKQDFDMCTQNLRDPYTRDKLRKRTSVVTNSATMKQALRGAQHRICCSAEEPHKPIRGRTWVRQDDGTWKSIALSSWAGGCTRKFAQTILTAALKDPALKLRSVKHSSLAAPVMTPLPTMPSLEEKAAQHGTFPLAARVDDSELVARRRAMDMTETAVLAVPASLRRRANGNVSEAEVPDAARDRFVRNVRWHYNLPMPSSGRSGDFSLGDNLNFDDSDLDSAVDASTTQPPRPSQAPAEAVQNPPRPSQAEAWQNSDPAADVVDAPRPSSAPIRPSQAPIRLTQAVRRGRPTRMAPRQRARRAMERAVEDEPLARRRRLHPNAEHAEEGKQAMTAATPDAWQAQVRAIQELFECR